jgi:hypothetical protein
VADEVGPHIDGESGAGGAGVFFFGANRWVALAGNIDESRVGVGGAGCWGLTDLR